MRFSENELRELRPLRVNVDAETSTETSLIHHQVWLAETGRVGATRQAVHSHHITQSVSAVSGFLMIIGNGDEPSSLFVTRAKEEYQVGQPRQRGFGGLGRCRKVGGWCRRTGWVSGHDDEFGATDVIALKKFRFIASALDF